MATVGYGGGGDRIKYKKKKLIDCSDEFFDDVAPRLYIFCFLVLFKECIFVSHTILTKYIPKPRSGDCV